MLRITRACDYTIRALIYMSQEPVGTTFMRSDIAEDCDIPSSFLGRILQNLAKSDILVSGRGKKGGFKLGLPLESIRLYDIIVAIDGGVDMNTCVSDPSSCKILDTCSAYPIWCDVQKALAKELQKYSLSDFAKKS